MSKGSIYYIACTETLRCKIGFTKGRPMERLRALQTGSAGHLVLMAVHPGTMEDEKALHARFSEQHVHGEWFDPSPELLEHVSMVVWLAGARAAATGQPLEDWVRVGLGQMHAQSPLPDHLAALL